MRALIAVTLATTLVGCGPGKKGNDTGKTGSTVPAPVIEFSDTVKSNGVEGDVGDVSLMAHRATNVVLGAWALAIADEGVRGKLAQHSEGRSSHCWDGPPIPQSFFTLDYTDCDTINGGILFNEDPLGPISLDFRLLTFDDSREITGALGLDAEGASAGSWVAFDTFGGAPTLDSRAPFAVGIDGQDVTVSFSGGGKIQTIDQNFAAWGVAEVTGFGDPQQLTVGGMDPAEISLNSATSDEPVLLPFDYLACRCPTSGLIGQTIEFQVNEVHFDLDNLKKDDDGVDDPEVSLAVSEVVTGLVETRITGCGEYEITFDDTVELSFEMSGSSLETAIDGLCETAVISDQQRCTAMKIAAGDVDSIEITVGNARLSTSVESEAATEFDTSYCHPE